MITIFIGVEKISVNDVKVLNVLLITKSMEFGGNHRIESLNFDTYFIPTIMASYSQTVLENILRLELKNEI